MRADDRKILEYKCPDCIDTTEQIQANGWPPADVQMKTVQGGVIARDYAEDRHK